jgi:hypothetical protein
VGAADDVDEDQGVEGDEGGGAQRLDAAPGGDAGGEEGDAEDGEGRCRLQGRDRRANREPRQGVGGEREQRAVGAGRFGPGDLGEGRIPRYRQRRVDVGVEAVADAEAGVGDVAVDVVGEEDRRQREGSDEEDDRPPDQP